ncbi:hypothetical protein KKF32_01195 [Patescibacteria group bacterium]|nr:hypothetical protein [Patescibacteria group bacterium]
MQRINEIIEIIEKTGDKCVVLKENNAFVIMTLADYKQLLKIPHQIEESLALGHSNNQTTVDIKEFEVPEEDKYYTEPMDY